MASVDPASATPSAKLYTELRAADLDFFVSVPCKLLSDLLVILDQDREIVYTPVAREEEGVGMACGAYLGGKHPVLVMQNSGLGNSINAVMALLNYYRVPVVFVISHRGSDGEPIEAQRMMGNITRDLLLLAQIDAINIESVSDLSGVTQMIRSARSTQKSLALLLPFSFWNER